MAESKSKTKNITKNLKKVMDPNTFWGDSYNKTFQPSQSKLYKKHKVREKAAFPKYYFDEAQPEPFKIPMRAKKH